MQWEYNKKNEISYSKLIISYRDETEETTVRYLNCPFINKSLQL